MSTENGTDLGAGQAVPSLNTRGNDEFASLVAETGGGSQQQGTTERTETKVIGTTEKPALEQTTLQKAAGAEQTQGTQQAGQQQTSTAAATTSTGTPGIDKALLDQIVETSVRAAAGARDQQAATAAGAQVKKDQKELTAAEFNEKYQIQPINEATIQAILDADPKKGAAMLQQLFIRNMGSAVLMAKDVIENRMTAMREEMSPHLSSWTSFQKEQREAKLETDFYGTNKDLVNEKPLVKEMQDAIFGRIASGQMKPFARPEDALKAVADATRAVLTRMGKSTNAGGSTAQTQSQQQGQGQQTHTRQMTAASTAGQSGAGHAAGKSDEETIFGRDYV